MNKARTTRIGLLGGLGPETTAMVYLNIINKAAEKTRPEIVIYNVPLNLKKEAEYITLSKNKAYYIEALKRGIKVLEKAEVSLIAIPCNTVHEFYDELQKSTKIPIINLIEEVGRRVKQRKWGSPFMFATSEIIESKLYQTALEQSGINLKLPDKSDQTKIDQVILQILQSNTHGEAQISILKKIITKYKAKNIILACSDLFKFFRSDTNVIDSMEVLSEECVKAIKKSRS